jgi:hypothetical protein
MNVVNLARLIVALSLVPFSEETVFRKEWLPQDNGAALAAIHRAALDRRFIAAKPASNCTAGSLSGRLILVEGFLRTVPKRLPQPSDLYQEGAPVGSTARITLW